MRSARMGAAVFVTAGMLGGAALGQANQSATPGKEGQAQRSARGDRAPDGFVLIEERVIVLTANEPQNHFLRAGELLISEDKKAAAGEVRMGANYLDMQASRAEGQAKQQLTSASQQLSSAARQLRGGGAQSAQQQQGRGQQQQGQPSQQQAAQQQQGQGGQDQAQAQRQQRVQQQLQSQARELIDAFAQANYALAQHFQSKAQLAIENKQPVVAGHELKAAADSLTAAVAWAGKQVPQDALESIAKAQQLASQMATPDGAEGEAQLASGRLGQDKSGEIPQNADQVVQELAKVIQRCGEEIKSSSPGSGSQSGASSGQQGGQK